MKLWRNKKNQKIYRVLKTDVINVTNNQDSKTYLYTRIGTGFLDFIACVIFCWLFKGQLYVRDYSEFVDKFEVVE